jgi:hypothetical protein
MHPITTILSILYKTNSGCIENILDVCNENITISSIQCRDTFLCDVMGQEVFPNGCYLDFYN